MTLVLPKETSDVLLQVGVECRRPGRVTLSLSLSLSLPFSSSFSFTLCLLDVCGEPQGDPDHSCVHVHVTASLLRSAVAL